MTSINFNRSNMFLQPSVANQSGKKDLPKDNPSEVKKQVSPQNIKPSDVLTLMESQSNVDMALRDIDLDGINTDKPDVFTAKPMTQKEIDDLIDDLSNNVAHFECLYLEVQRDDGQWFYIGVVKGPEIKIEQIDGPTTDD